jgi:phosphopantothenoylcysteine decarboxylase/phosphopantothenate--cysteine ligase
MGSTLSGKKVLLGITGGIAAYKTAELCRNLTKAGASVRVVMTAGAQQFITPLTMQALSGNVVHTELLDPEAEAGMGHIELAKWPDLIVVAPATADFISRYANGAAGDLLNTLLLATVSPVMIAPAMNQAMWLNKLTQRNLRLLEEILEGSLTVLGPSQGEQACGDVGPGRMLEPEEISDAVEAFFSNKPSALLSGRRVVISAGPTQEALDPVRYISNHSSGKMGYALAEKCAEQGAEVILISGPTKLEAPMGVKRIDVLSAIEMKDAVLSQLYGPEDIFIACAAVADYRPQAVESKKMKKKPGEGETMTIVLEQNPDIVATVAARADKPFTVGFAAETHDVLEYARGKLQRKNLDMIIANDVSNPEIGFNSDENEAWIISRDDEKAMAKQSKSSLAHEIVKEISKKLG